VPGSDYILGGPLFWVMTGLLFLTAMLAAFVVIDCLRRTLAPGSRPAEPLRWFYVVPQALYFVLLLSGQTGAIPAAVVVAVVLATPLVLAQGIAYLLRVVFPKQPSAELAADPEESELLSDGGDTIEPESTR